jgi:hypothetical protein
MKGASKWERKGKKRENILNALTIFVGSGLALKSVRLEHGDQLAQEWVQLREALECPKGTASPKVTRDHLARFLREVFSS